MPYIEVKTRIVCECVKSYGDSPDPSCTICAGLGYIEKWESFDNLYWEHDMIFDPRMD